MKRRQPGVFGVSLLLASAALGQSAGPGYPPKMEGARTEVYRKVGSVELRLWIFVPDDHNPDDARPAIVFFFGGGWKNGSPKQFEQHCRYLAGRGMVAMTADYRVSSRHGTPAVACVEDAREAVRWIRTNAGRLGVDAKRIAAGGGSAGGHLAACAGVIDDPLADKTAVSSRPDALVLFNPALVLAPIPGVDSRRMPAGLAERMGVDPEKLSPWHHVGSDEPPTLILHGQADKTVPFVTARLFAEKMRQHGAQCELRGYADQGHGFFNYGRSNNVMFRKTVADMDAFLVKLGYLPANPTASPAVRGSRDLQPSGERP